MQNPPGQLAFVHAMAWRKQTTKNPAEVPAFVHVMAWMMLTTKNPVGVPPFCLHCCCCCRQQLPLISVVVVLGMGIASRRIEWVLARMRILLFDPCRRLRLRCCYQPPQYQHSQWSVTIPWVLSWVTWQRIVKVLDKRNFQTIVRIDDLD